MPQPTTARLVTEASVQTALSNFRGATTSRPSATAVSVGAQYYDTTLKKPIWSDGSVWRDASGTSV